MKLGIGAGEPSTLAKRLAGLTFLRLLVLGAFLAITELYYNRQLSFGGFSTQVSVSVVAVAFALTAAYAVLLRRGKSLERLAFAQLLTDQLTWTAVAYVSGGVTSGSTSLYGLTCLSGAILLGTRGAVSAALVGMLSYLGLCAAFASGVLPPPVDQSPDAYVVDLAEMVYPAVTTVLATALVASLAGYLSERLRSAGGQLEAATERAERAEQLAMLGRLSAALAHEIRNPLGAIRGSIELLRTGGELSEEDRRLCAVVEREVARLDDLVGDMVDLGRPREPHRRAVDLVAAARSVVALANRDRDDSTIEVSYHGPSSLSISADAAQMRQVLWNLVRNGVQASADHGRVRIEISSDEDGGELRVHDDGVGIPESQRGKIFDAFFTTRTHGVGIGLAVVKRICEAHGFTLQVQSDPDQGTTVAMRIPKAALTLVGAALLVFTLGCGGSGWLDARTGERDEVGDDAWWTSNTADPPAASSGHAARPPTAPAVATSGSPVAAPPHAGRQSASPSTTKLEVFRNTYYDFPREVAGGSGSATRQLFDAGCQPIGRVARSFHDAVCVQGSGRLASGQTVSFARRACPCAAVCPRTGQQICFEVLDPQRFPHGRGATGRPITPLRSVAVDPTVVPLGTALYIPSFQGLRGPDGKPHDGCFVADDRGLEVRGKHVDVFTGDPATTRSWNAAVPSNKGVRVMVGASRCAHLSKRARQ